MTQFEIKYGENDGCIFAQLFVNGESKAVYGHRIEGVGAMPRETVCDLVEAWARGMREMHQFHASRISNFYIGHKETMKLASLRMGKQ